eukprot:NODE_12864_length_1199_cov_3.442164.p1 GENE.NODE_12864_length_1199_cov_3.442164~~NODE_12864_length_1199_cov_3.442164.p1  ORF type:complete len:280 (+),score=50.63 NODE_12864_length_1199_cov_3.442164:271-1110(+)
MEAFEPLTDGFSPGLPYGLGLIEMFNGFPFKNDDLHWIGHGGVDYASACPVCGYNPKYEFSIAISMTTLAGMNCSDLPSSLAFGHNASSVVPMAVYEYIVNEVAGSMGKPTPFPEAAHLLPSARLRVATSAPQVALSLATTPHLLGAAAGTEWKCPADIQPTVSILPTNHCISADDGSIYMLAKANTTDIVLSIFSSATNAEAASCSGKPASRATFAANECLPSSSQGMLNTMKVNMLNESVAVFETWIAGGVTTCEWSAKMPSGDIAMPAKTITQFVI